MLPLKTGEEDLPLFEDSYLDDLPNYLADLSFAKFSLKLAVSLK